MKLTTLLAMPLLALTTATPHPWTPAGPSDVRGPCPMMNTLANHAYLPHDGLAIDKPTAVAALTTALNFNASLAALMFDMAIKANPSPNATYFTLDHLNRHNVLEHDASLSRADAYLGNNHVFNQSIFDAARRWWTAETLTAEMLANSKVARQLESRASNPEYAFTATTEQFSLGEVAAPVIVFGDMARVLVNRTLVEYFFENERLPSELGWVRKQEAVSVEDVNKVTQAIGAATSLLTGEAATLHRVRRGDFHAGLGF